jgi:hypothetical protein
VRRLAKAAAGYPPTATPTTVTSGRPGVRASWAALNENDNETATGFSFEPPDQGLCVGNGKVLELTNIVGRVYSTSGTALSPTVSLSALFGEKELFDPSTNTYGIEPTDPSCVFDPATQRFYLAMLALELDPTTGNLTLKNHVDIAVSKTSNPMGGYWFYSITTTDSGGANGPKHKDCPCVGDYPHIGTDAHGFYLTTNEYPWTSAPGVFGNNFNGAQLYAMSKTALASGTSRVHAIHFSHNVIRPSSGGTIAGFTMLPVQASGTAFAMGAGGTMYFLSSTAAEESRPGAFTGQSDSMALWRLVNTSSLDSSTPRVRLRHALVTSQPYGVPPMSDQKAGPTPLRDCVQAVCFGRGDPYFSQGENGLDSSDSRVLTAWYAGGKVIGALDTAATVSGNEQSAAAWFVLTPSGSGASMSSQGYLGVRGNNVTYPAVATDPSGVGALGFTLVGNNHYPSAAYSGWRTPTGPTSVYVANEGKAPEDGFCEYNFFNCAQTATPLARPRWGDYGAAVYDGSSLYVANEDIATSCSFKTFSKDPTCGGTRTYFGNFSTQITRLTVGGF